MTCRSDSRPIENVAEASGLLADVFARKGRIAVLTGAGISTESGIPDYRSPAGIWASHAPIQYQAFVSDKAARLEDWRRRFHFHGEFLAARPNAAHMVLAQQAGAGNIDLVMTQNIDGLHGRSGLPDLQLVELHGNGTFAHCLDCRLKADLMAQKAIADTGRSPRCTACGGLLKAAVVSFGETMPHDRLVRAAEAARRCDVFLVLGSSLAVHPAAQLPQLAAAMEAEIIIVNAEPTSFDDLALHLIRTPLAKTFEPLLHT